MSDTVTVAAIPPCDLCKAHGVTPPNVAAYDGKTTVGPWAYMCEEHYASHGVGLGTGRGQRLLLAVPDTCPGVEAGGECQCDDADVFGADT